MTRPRQSNIELLRLVAMLLILVIHADYMSIGFPSRADMTAEPAATTARIAFEALGIMAVNLFVLISGWFGIRWSLRSIGSFLFQVGYFYLGIIIVMLCIGSIDTTGFAGIVTDYRTIYWFVPKYLGLYLIAPLLNRFIAAAPARSLNLTVAGFYLLQTAGWATEFRWLTYGYTTTSFIGLYLLAAWLRRIRSRIPLAALIAVFALCLAGNAIIGYHTLTIESAQAWFLAYDSPLVVLQAAATLLIFLRIPLGVRPWINRIAASAFAIYLLNDHILLAPVYHRMVLSQYIGHTFPAAFAGIAAVVLLWFAAALILDIPRRALWTAIARKIRILRPSAA